MLVIKEIFLVVHAAEFTTLLVETSLAKLFSLVDFHYAAACAFWLASEAILGALGVDGGLARETNTFVCGFECLLEILSTVSALLRDWVQISEALLTVLVASLGI